MKNGLMIVLGVAAVGGVGYYLLKNDPTITNANANTNNSTNAQTQQVTPEPPAIQPAVAAERNKQLIEALPERTQEAINRIANQPSNFKPTITNYINPSVKSVKNLTGFFL